MSTNNIDITDESIVRTILSEMEKSEDLDRREHSFDLWQVYSGNVTPYVQNELRRTREKSWEGYTIPSISIAKMIVDRVGKAYKQAPDRYIENDDTDIKTQRLTSILAECDAHRQYPYFDKIINLHKYGLLWLTYRENEQRYQMLALQPHEFAVVRSKDTGKLECVILNYGDDTITSNSNTGDGHDDLIAENQADSAAQTRVYAMWTNTHVVTVKVTSSKVKTARGQDVKKSITYVTDPNNPDMLNKIGIIPFVFLSRELSFDLPTLSPLLHQTVTANALMSEWLTASNIQGTGQLVYSYSEKLEGKFRTLTKGLLTALKLIQPSDPDEPRTEVNYISPNPNLQGMSDAVMRYIQAIFKEQGITTGSMIGSDSESFTSGLDRALANANVDDIINSNQELYVGVEKQIFEIIKAYETFFESNVFDQEDELVVTFKKPKILISDRETLENIQLMEDLGLISKNKALRMIDPNLTEEQAQTVLDEIAQERANLVNSARQAIDGRQVDQNLQP